MTCGQPRYRGSARAPGTCGELAQGMVNGHHVQVTCPVDIYSRATVKLSPGPGTVEGPEDSPKARMAVRLTLAHVGREEFDARLHLESPLPREKGMGSSTADVAAAIVATAAALGRRLSPQDVAKIALQVEPSDGVMIPGIALFDHRDGKVARELGSAPAMRVLVLDFGGTINTGTFNALDRTETLMRQAPRVKEALAMITEGLRDGDIGLIGKGATRSALTHQHVFPNAHLRDVMRFARQAGAIGVNVAHSGTVLGVLFDDDCGLVKEAERDAATKLCGLETTYNTRLIGGGVIISEDISPIEVV